MIPMNKLMIQRIRIDGEYTFDKEFTAGLHILAGTTNSCGKSLFVQFIDFALGDNGDELKKYNILKQCTFLFAQIKINDDIFSIRRNINIINKEIDIFRETTIEDILNSKDIKYETKSIDEYQRELFKKLTSYDYISTVSLSTGNKKTISFSFFSNLFYLNQGVQAGQIFRYNDIFFPSHLRKKVFSLYLNTNEIKKAIPELEMHDKKEEYNSALDKLNIERQFFSQNITDNNYYAEKEKHDRLVEEISGLKDKLQKVDTDISHIEIISNGEQQSLFNKNSQLRKVKDDISNLKTEIKEQTKLVNDYREDYDKTQQNIAAFKLFKSFELKTCPECGRNIVSTMEDKNCPLCKEEIDAHKNNEDYISKNMSYLAYLKDSLNDCIEVLDHKQTEMKEKAKNESELEKEISVINSSINDKISKLKLPIVDTKIALKSNITQKEQEQAKSKANLEVLEKFREKESSLENIKMKIKELTKVINKIEHDEENAKKEKELLDLFGLNFNQFFNNLNYPFIDKVYIDESLSIRVTTSKDGQRDIKDISSASDKIILRLGLFYSLLKTALENNQINHPRLLYLDSPRDQELKWERFCESLIRFKELIEKEKDGQVFITVVIDGNNKFEGIYNTLNEYVFMTLSNKENERLLRKPEIKEDSEDAK